MCILYGAPDGQDARILAEMARALMPEDRVLMHIALDDRRMAELEELLAFFAPDVSVVKFPAWDCLPYDRVSPSGDIVAARVTALSRLLGWEEEAKRYPRIVLTSVNAAVQRVMPREALRGASFTAQRGGTLDLEAMQAFLIHNGYTRTETVREAGEYAMRGGIIDLFPSGFRQPVRLDLFGDEIETIRAFDPDTQRSADVLKSFSLQPVSELFLDKESISRFRKGYLESFGVVRADDPLYEAVSEGRRYNGMEHWLPLFYDHLDTLFDYVPGAQVTFDHHAPESHDERMEQVQDFFSARQTMRQATLTGSKKEKSVSISGALYNPLPVETLYLAENHWDTLVQQAKVFSPFSGGQDDKGLARKGRDFADIRAMPDGDIFAELKTYISSLDVKTLLAAYSEGSADRLAGLLNEHGLKAVRIQNWDAVKKLKPDQIGVAVLALENGFVAPDLAVLSETDIFGDRLTRKSSKNRKADNFLREVSSLNEGDLVVHIDHGVGKFIALETLKAAGTLHDCLKIEYAGGDKLYVPVESLEVLARFGADEGAVQLDKLGGAGWQARKARVKKDLMAMADHLLSIAAARKLKKAQKLDVNEQVYNQFAAKFPYSETEDQERAITDVIADISGDYPMDRLICGDVGFGKTEVAIRAAYVAAMAGAQVALVVPTTLLARQHYNNFSNRFAGSGIRVEQLSRLVSPKQAEKVKEAMRDGHVNIVIGTHALFGKGVKFDNLGLVIVDEEQRFGVKQKERLKELKSDVHVLTLSATPIPRTLQMSLTGVKEMSLITTPPVDRLAIRTFVMPFDGMIIREALMREHYRGGQSFYVCPRIKDMKELQDNLKDIVPELKVVTAHGQMTPTELEDRMTAFYEGQYDILLATNIIESGIDIASANTMIVHRADMFGLAQLYQIRGRIGRSKMRAYAYLTYQPGLKLNDQAMKRLEVMETLDTLGAGFQLASHDMDIRGAGNLLGEQQSGHIREVGAELYQQMLEEAVAAAREGVGLDDMKQEQWAPQINLGISILIPENYVEELGVRMSLYRRLQDLETPDDIEGFAAEMIDRFGKLPEEVENLLSIVAIKQLCKKSGVSHVDAGPKGAVIAFKDNAPPNVGALMNWIQSKAGTVKIRPDQKLSVIRVWEKPHHRVNGVRTLMKELSKL
ncbi:MAG: transcription-repair coupling factor [Micavibrio sp.]|nr:transcription-repair coupling factor [Micavibrio sp.]